MLALAFNARAEETPGAVFDRVWDAARESIYPHTLVASHFTEATRERLAQAAAAAPSVDALRPIINPFLDSLEVSHTRFYTAADLEYTFFRSLFSTRELDAPGVAHLGYQSGAQPERVREVLDGLPAAVAGVRRGDRLLDERGEPIEQVVACRRPEATSRAYRFIIERGSQRLPVQMTCVEQNPNASMLTAMEASVRRLPLGERSVGYLHLWSGTHERILARYLELVDSLADTDALILDLRGGFGGAWYEYLDPFFPDRSEFYRFTVLDREGSETFSADPVATHGFYDKPMVVLINEGVRSGKEALAYQFKKSRALVLGSTTAGFFSAGQGIFNEPDEPYFLYLSVAEFRLNDERIEGRGVTPSVTVPYPVDEAHHVTEDPQFKAAMEALETVFKAALPG
ncbi:MAG: S41 family peptidase [Pseudomonadota bacterium]